MYTINVNAPISGNNITESNTRNTSDMPPPASQRTKQYNNHIYNKTNTN